MGDTPTNPTSALNNQEGASKWAQMGSTPNVNDTTGSVNVSYDANGQPTVTRKLNDAEQGVYNTNVTNRQMFGTAGQEMFNNWYNQYGSKDPTEQILTGTNSLTNQIAGGQIAALDPFMQKARQEQVNDLHSRGVFENTPGFDNAMNTTDRNRILQYGGLTAAAQPAAYNMASSLFKTAPEMAAKFASGGSYTNPEYIQPTGLNMQAPNYLGTLPGITQQSVGQDPLSQNNMIKTGMNIAQMPMGGGGSTTPGTMANGGWSTTTTPASKTGLPASWGNFFG